MRQPIGPVGVIMLSTWKTPALAAGCTVVHKPAEWSPLSAVILTEIMDEVIRTHDGPAGVVNLVHGLGETAGKSLTEHPAIKAVAFVGETTTGSHIMRQGAATLKRVHFELGGKNPVIVFDDADLDRALDAVLFMIYSLNGERCTSSSRALVQRSIHDSFAAKAAARVAAIKAYARDLRRVWRAAEALEYGMVGVNTGLISTAEAPFGGIKQSGVGREGSRYGIEDFTEIKYVCLGGL